jgi:hypothetical protein
MRRHRLDEGVRPTKTAQTFFVLARLPQL